MSLISCRMAPPLSSQSAGLRVDTSQERCSKLWSGQVGQLFGWARVQPSAQLGHRSTLHLGLVFEEVGNTYVVFEGRPVPWGIAPAHRDGVFDIRADR